MKMRYSIIIPCYNEAENLENLVDKIEVIASKYDLEFILVENGSVDNSRSIFENNPKLQQVWIRKVYVDVNQGYGYGLWQGAAAAKGDYVGWIHADMQVKPEDLYVFLEFLEKGYEYEESGSHFFLKGKRKKRNFTDCFFTWGMSVFETLLFHCRLLDIGAVPVVFHRDLLERCVYHPSNFSVETYIYVLAVKEGYKVLRHPVMLEKREKGKSSWDKGIRSKINLSRLMIKDSLKIKNVLR